MRATRYFFIIITLIILLSCVTDPEQYIPIHIINNTSEVLEVYQNHEKYILADYSIPKFSSYTITGIIGAEVTIKGKDSGKNYGTKKFYSEGTWEVN